MSKEIVRAYSLLCILKLYLDQGYWSDGGQSKTYWATTDEAVHIIRLRRLFGSISKEDVGLGVILITYVGGITIVVDHICCL